MIEKIIIDHLKTELGIPVYAEIPAKVNYPFVIVSKTGGNKKNHVWHSLFAIQSYDSTLLKAAKLNEDVIDVMYEAEKLDKVCSVSVNSNYQFNDTTNKRYRYQAVFDIYHY